MNAVNGIILDKYRTNSISIAYQEFLFTKFLEVGRRSKKLGKGKDFNGFRISKDKIFVESEKSVFTRDKMIEFIAFLNSCGGFTLSEMKLGEPDRFPTKIK